jgi:hypothetical protein
MEDPRIGSPFNLMFGMLETLAILRLTSVQWPGPVAQMLNIVSLVNFNVEVFQTQCLLGLPHPITGALAYAGSLFGAMAIAAAFWLLLLLTKRVFPIDFESLELDEQSLEGACYAVRPDRANPDLNVPLEYTPTQCLRRASLSEYAQISGTVRRPTRVNCREGCRSIGNLGEMLRLGARQAILRLAISSYPAWCALMLAGFHRSEHSHACMAQVHSVSWPLGGLLHNIGWQLRHANVPLAGL